MFWVRVFSFSFLIFLFTGSLSSILLDLEEFIYKFIVILRLFEGSRCRSGTDELDVIFNSVFLSSFMSIFIDQSLLPLAMITIAPIYHLTHLFPT